jgi:integrase
MYWKNGAYWLVKRQKWTRLGAERRSALIVYARLTAPRSGAMAALIDEALPQLLHGKAVSTVRQYRYAAEQLRHVLADFEPKDVTTADVYDLLEQFRDTPNMGNRVLTVAGLVFTYAARRGLVSTNPCVGVQRLPEAKRDRYLTDVELAAIRRHAGPRLRLLVDLLYTTGQRVTDVAGIRRRDVTKAGLEFQQQKTGTRRTIAWNQDLRAAVKAAEAMYPARKGDEEAGADWLLRGRWGGRVDYKSLHEQWTRACRAAGVEDAHIHDVRAKSATDAKKAGLDATALMGHASQAMTARYLRLRESPVVKGPRVRYLIDKGSR